MCWWEMRYLKPIKDIVAIVIKDNEIQLVDETFAAIRGEVIKDPVILLKDNKEFLQSVYPTMATSKKPNYPILMFDINKLKNIHPFDRVIYNEKE